MTAAAAVCGDGCRKMCTYSWPHWREASGFFLFVLFLYRESQDA